jgi:hypothetical protein
MAARLATDAGGTRPAPTVNRFRATLPAAAAYPPAR